MFVICHVRLLVGIQFRFATVHSSVTQPEPASIGSVLPRANAGLENRVQFSHSLCRLGLSLQCVQDSTF